MSKHSVGPWTHQYIGSGDWEVDDADGRWVATVGYPGRSRHEPDGDEAANARLIAAAPELLVVARMAAELRCLHEPADRDRCMVCRAKDIIARIEGEP